MTAGSILADTRHQGPSRHFRVVGREEEVKWADLREFIKNAHFKSLHVRAAVVLAELEEANKPKRDATQEEIAGRYGASDRALRYWVRRYSRGGLEALRHRGGQGAKPRHPREKVRQVIDDCLDETGEAPADGGGEREPCEACEARERGEKPKKDPPGPCPCRRGCRPRRGSACHCARGRACKCWCCQPMRLRPKGPRHAPDCPGRRISPKNGTSVARVRAAMREKLGDCYCERHTRRLMAEVKSLTYRRITRQQRNHASRKEVAGWQGRLKISIKKYEADDWAVYIHDEGHAVHDKKTGHVWGPRGERSTLPRAGSGLRVTYSPGHKFLTHFF